jgi:hypothetical protein
MCLAYLRSVIALACVLFSLHASAQATAAEITDAQIAEMRGTIEPGCVARGKARGAPEHDVVSFCTCMTKVLDANVPMETWRQMAWLGTQHQGAEAAKLLSSFAPLLQTCKDHEADSPPS